MCLSSVGRFLIIEEQGGMCNMRILMAGGGSGGHVTPLRAIIESLPQKTEEVIELMVITDRAFYGQTQFLFKNHDTIRLKKIFSGKYRRYNGKSALWHVTHLPTLLLNLRDVLFLGIGLLQSINYFIWYRPDVVFCKGGYVCVPVGVAARIFNVPLVIHDSDTHPGLTNRFLSRWARKIGTGMPAKYYSYPVQKMFYSGIPVQKTLTAANEKQRNEAKIVAGLTAHKPVLLVTGGGTGATFINNAICAIASDLLDAGWQIMHLTGKNKANSVHKARGRVRKELQDKWHVQEFAEIAPMVCAADLIVTRAGATAMQEFANAKKSVIIIPSPHLTGGHQLKNAAMFSEHKAACVLQEADIEAHPSKLFSVINEFYTKPETYKAMAQSLYDNFAKPLAADEIAKVIVAEARKH